VSPRAAVIAKIRDGGTIKLLYGQAFRAPNLYEKEFTDGGALIPLSTSLRPEFFTSYEALVEQVFTPSLKGTFSLYRNDARASIGLQALPSVGAPIQRIQQQNLGTARSMGVESEVELEAFSFVGRASVALQSSTDVASGAVLANSPQTIGNLNVMSPLLLRRQVRVGLEARGMSARRDLAGNRIAPHAIANLVLSTAPRPRGPIVTAGVYNMFNAQYTDPTSYDTAIRAVLQDPRNVRITLGWGL
jgi:outer membrane receptor for ferrienterochelin and colicins